MQITFTLSPSYTGSTFVAGPFDISGTTSEGTSYWLATGITKTELTTGYIINTIYETLTSFTINSTGTCSTSQNLSIANLPTFSENSPTPTPTATVSITSYAYDISPNGEASSFLSCSNYEVNFPTVVYAASEFINGVVRFFTDPQLSIGYGGSGDFYAYKRDYQPSSAIKSARVSPSGFLSEISNC